MTIAISLIEFVFEVLLGLDFSLQRNTGLGATKQRHPVKAGSYHSESLQQVIWPSVVLFVSCGSFSAIFRMERNDT